MRDASRNQCRWIDTYIRSHPRCCGETTHKRSSWCKEHYSKVFREDGARAKVQFNSAAKYFNIPRKKKY